MLPMLQGEGSKSAKGGTLMSKLFGRAASNNSSSEAESPRNASNGLARVGGELTTSSNTSDHASMQNWKVSPRQPGAAVTTGFVPHATPGKISPTSLVTSRTAGEQGSPVPASPRRVLFAAGPSAKSLEVAAEGAGSFDNKVAGMLDHTQAFKRSHTTDLNTASSGNSSDSLGGSLRRFTPLAQAANEPSSRATAISPIPGAGLVAGPAGPDQKLQASRPGEPTKVAPAQPRVSSGGGGRIRSPSLVVEFAEPRHQQRPSLIAAVNQQSTRGPVHAAASRNAATAVTTLDADDAKSFMETAEEAAASPADNALSKGPSLDPLQTQKAAAAATAGKPVTHADALAAEEARKAEAAKRDRQREQAVAAAPAPSATVNVSAAARPAATEPARPVQPQQHRKYKLLSAYPLMEPSMRREEWALSQFAIDKKLHAGYASEVYRAKDHQSGELMAVKVYKLSQLGSLNKVQLIREIRLHGSFAHRNIIELYCAFQEDERVVLVQRYAESGDLLKALHHAGGRLTERSAVQMVIQPLLTCLVYLHSKGITHRDIKPENILFDGEGILKLADFGLAINTNEEHAVTRAGTLHYMAPEVVKNPLKDHPDDYKNEVRFHYNAVVDSWAVGCLAYELLVGFPPFMAQTQQEVVKNISTMEVQYPKKMSEECADFISQALQRDPVHRATASELLRHPWITIHQRRNSVRNLHFEAQGSPAANSKLVPDFASGTAMAKNISNARRPADHGPSKSREGSKMAPF